MQTCQNQSHPMKTRWRVIPVISFAFQTSRETQRRHSPFQKENRFGFKGKPKHLQRRLKSEKKKTKKMLRVAARRVYSLCSTQPPWRPNQAASAIVSRNPIAGGDSSLSEDFKSKALNDFFAFRPHFHLPNRGLSFRVYLSQI